MSRRKVIEKRLNTIQNFGAMDVLCTDKTGTLTQDRVILEMLRSRSLAHPFRTSQPHLQAKFHGIDPSTLPALSRKDVGGRLLSRPKRDDPAATVAEFCTADYTHGVEKTVFNQA